MELKKISDDSLGIHPVSSRNNYNNSNNNININNDSKLALSRNTTKSYHFMNITNFSDLESDNDIDDFQANIPSSNTVKRSTVYFNSKVKIIKEYKDINSQRNSTNKRMNLMKLPINNDSSNGNNSNSSNFSKVSCDNCGLTLCYLIGK